MQLYMSIKIRSIGVTYLHALIGHVMLSISLSFIFGLDEPGLGSDVYDANFLKCRLR